MGRRVAGFAFARHRIVEQRLQEDRMYAMYIRIYTSRGEAHCSAIINQRNKNFGGTRNCGGVFGWLAGWSATSQNHCLHHVRIVLFFYNNQSE